MVLLCLQHRVALRCSPAQPMSSTDLRCSISDTHVADPAEVRCAGAGARVLDDRCSALDRKSVV